MQSLAKLFLAMLIFAIRAGLSTQNDSSPFQDLVWNKTYTSAEIKNGVASQYRDGDVIIGLMIAQHIASEQQTCGDIESDGVQVMEIVNMLIEKINANDSILPGVKLGTLALDTCTIDTHTVRMVVGKTFPYYWQVDKACNFHNGTTEPSRGLRPFAGFIGAGESDVTILSSKILQVFKIPQVSYLSTNPELSDKNVYPYVFRTVPSDAHQAEAMMKFIQSKGWNYISVVYSDTLYGSRAFSKIQEQAKKYGICIALGQPIIPVSPQKIYDDAVQALLKHIEAGVVILFAVTREAEKVLQAAQNSPEARNRFIWIASDGWTSFIPTMKNDTTYIDQLRRSVGFMPKASALPEFETYFEKLRLKDRAGANNSLNPWFAPYLSRQLGCRLIGPSLAERICAQQDHLTAGDYEPSAITHYMSDALLIFVQALNNLHNQKCKGQPGLCKELKCTLGTNALATQVFPHLKNASIQGIHGGQIRFDKNQDGPPSYDLRTYDFIKEKGVYGWSRAALFENNAFKLSTPLLDGVLENISSVCSVPCKSNEKKHILDKVCCWTCIPCASDEVVAPSGTECRNCSITEEPNVFRNVCKSLEWHNLQPGSPFTIVPILVSTLGILLTICISAIYIKYRDTPIVKACSKELSAFVVVGVVICLLNGYVTIGGLNRVTCAVSRIILSMGPAFMYSGLLTKTIRIVIIFQSKNFLKKHWKVYIRPIPQIITTMVLIIFQVFIITTWFLMSPNKISYTTLGRLLYHDCSAIKDAEILIALAFPLILIAMCTVLATINRNVPSGFNETRYVGFTMYTTCVIWLAFVPIVLLNADKVPLKSSSSTDAPLLTNEIRSGRAFVMTTSVCLSLSAITVMTCLFGPRCYDIILRPDRNTPEAVMATVATRGRSKSEALSPVSTGKALSTPRKSALTTDLSSEG